MSPSGHKNYICINTYGWGQVEVGKMFGIVTDHRKKSTHNDDRLCDKINIILYLYLCDLYPKVIIILINLNVDQPFIKMLPLSYYMYFFIIYCTYVKVVDCSAAIE